MSAAIEQETTNLISQIFDRLRYLLPKDIAMDSKKAMEVVPVQASGRNEIVARLISTCLGLAVSISVSYFGIKWLGNILDPTRQEKKEAQLRAKKLMTKLGLEEVQLSEYELCIASNLVDPLSMSVSWHDIGGLEGTINKIKECVILPFRNHRAFARSKLLQPPKGVLLYGPPGCGKTLIAKATAKAAGARFLNLQISSLVDKWYGESQKRAEAVFSLALKLQPTIIFIDEIDAFLRSRNSADHEATAMIKTQFMSFWDGLTTDQNSRVMIMGATNRPQDVDAAILRRMPSMFHIALPNETQRRSILRLILSTEEVDDDLDLDQVAAQTQGWSGSDLQELCRTGAVLAMRENLHHSASGDVMDTLIPIRQQDIAQAMLKMRSSKISKFQPSAQIDVD